MNLRRSPAVLCFILAVCSGCANQTTDPHQGGLFSYNPQAYEQRLKERQQRLSAAEQHNKAMQAETAELETEKSGQAREAAFLKKQMADLEASTKALEKKVAAIQAQTAAQKTKHQQILAELAAMRASFKATDDIPDPEEKRLELKRLRKIRDRLENEIVELQMQL